MEFWAVGTDCCALHGAFRCGAASDADARGGAILFSSPRRGPIGALFGGDNAALAHYDMARKKARATLGAYLGRAEDAVMVEWMTTQKLAMLSRNYAERAWVFIAVSSFVYTIVSAPLAWLASRMAIARSSRHGESTW